MQKHEQLDLMHDFIRKISGRCLSNDEGGARGFYRGRVIVSHGGLNRHDVSWGVGLRIHESFDLILLFLT